MMVIVMVLVLRLRSVTLRIHHRLLLDLLLLDLLLLLLLLLLLMMMMCPPSSPSSLSHPSTAPHSLLNMFMAMRVYLPKEGMGQGIPR